MFRAFRLLVCVLLLAGCNAMPEFPPVPADFQPVAVDRHGIALHLNPDPTPRPLLVMVHGTPGDWRTFEWYLADDELNRDLRTVAPDRPGFGVTELPLTVSLHDQAAALLAALPSDQPMLVAGHSLGGPVALEMALQAPQRVCGVLLISASLDPALEQPHWYNHVAAWSWVRALLPPMWRASNDEMFALAGGLREMLAHLDALHAPVLLIQGRRDRLVDPRSPQALIRRLPADRLTLYQPEQAGHFLVWDDPDWVAQRALELERISRTCLKPPAARPESEAVR